ncbi:MAG TPA: NAD(P)/FAD-dependent oxidoreductase [Anaerolineae bacterium]
MSADRQHDVVVIGAGPAGLSAGRTIARLGFRTLILERLPAAGELRHPCSGVITPIPGFVPARRLLDGLFMPSLDLLIPSSLILGYPPTQRVISPGGYQFQAFFSDRDAFPAAVVDKPGLLRMMARQAQSAGAELRYNASVTGLLKEGGQVTGVRVGDEEIKAAVVLSGEGANRRFSREAGIGPQRPSTRQVILISQDMLAPALTAEHVGQILTVGRRYTSASHSLGMLVVPGPGRATIFLTIYADAGQPPSDAFLWFYLDEYVHNDARVRDLLAGATVLGRTRHRVALEDAPEHVVTDGFLGMGDAITPAGHLGILPSIYMGRQAAFMAAEALDAADVSAALLAPYDEMLHETILPNLETEARVMLGLARMDDAEIDRLCQQLNNLHLATPFFSNWRTLAWEMVSWMVRQYPLMIHDWQLLQRVAQGGQPEA